MSAPDPRAAPMPHKVYVCQSCDYGPCYIRMRYAPELCAMAAASDLVEDGKLSTGTWQLLGISADEPIGTVQP